jgi:hypothetical protein
MVNGAFFTHAWRFIQIGLSGLCVKKIFCPGVTGIVFLFLLGAQQDSRFVGAESFCV